MDLVQLRGADHAPVLKAAQRMNQIRESLTGAADEMKTSVRNPLADGWQGEASVAALAHHDRVGDDVAATIDVFERAGRELEKFADDLLAAGTLVSQADEVARAAGLSVGADGSMTSPEPVTESEADRMRAAGEEATRRYEEALNLATAADSACAAALATAVGAGALAWSGVETSASAPMSGGVIGAAVGGEWTGSATVGGDSLFEQVTGLFVEQEASFEESPLGEAIHSADNGFIIEGEDGHYDIGDLSYSQQVAFEENFNGTPEEVLGEDTVNAISEEGWSAAPGAWFQENVLDVPQEFWDNNTERVENFVDDPVGSLAGALGL